MIELFQEFVRMVSEGTCIAPMAISAGITALIAIIVVTFFFAQVYLETGRTGAKKLNRWRKISLARTKH